MFKSEKELNEAIEEAKASFEIEGLIITEEMEKIIKAKVGGKITMEQFIKLSEAIAKRE